MASLSKQLTNDESTLLSHVLWCWPLRPAQLAAPTEVTISFFSGSQEDLLHAIGDADAVVIRREVRIDECVLARAPRLRFVQRAGTSTANIDLGAARRRGIRVAATPMRLDIAVAEHTIGLMLALARRLPQSHEDVLAGAYVKNGLQPTLTSEAAYAANWMSYSFLPCLYGRTLGLVGLGEIGVAVAKRARAFGMEVVYFRRNRLSTEDEHLLGVRFAPLPELQAISDFVSLHVPHTPATNRLVDERFLRAMKPSAFLVNVSRGGLIDEPALIDALEKGLIAGAGLDVFAHEPVASSDPLLRAPNLIATPHTASGSDLALDFEDVFENIRRFARGEYPRDLV